MGCCTFSGHHVECKLSNNLVGTKLFHSSCESATRRGNIFGSPPFTLPMLPLYNTSIPCPACLLPLLKFNVLPRSHRPSLLLAVFPSARPDFTCCPFFSGVDASERHEHAPRRSICDVIGGARVRTPDVGEHNARSNTVQGRSTKPRATGARKKTRKQKNKRNRKSARKSVLFSHSGSASISAMTPT